MAAKEGCGVEDEKRRAIEAKEMQARLEREKRLEEELQAARRQRA